MQDNTSNRNSSFQLDPVVFISYLFRYWYLLVIGLAAGLTYGYYQMRYTTPVYQTNSRMLVKDEYSSWGQEYFLPGMELVSGRNRLINEIGIINSYPLLERVSEKLNWNISYFRIGNIKTTELYPNTSFSIESFGTQKPSGSYYLRFLENNTFKIARSIDELGESEEYELNTKIKLGSFEFSVKTGRELSDDLLQDDYLFRYNRMDAMVRGFQSSLRMDVENSESSILILSENNITPQKSIDFLNTLMKTYIDWGVEQNNEIASNTIKFVDNQLSVIADSLVITEYKLEQFQKQNFKDRIYFDGITTEGENSSNINEVVKLEDQLTSRSIQREYYNALLKTLNDTNAQSFPSSAIFGFSDPNIDKMIDSYWKSISELRDQSFQLNTTNQLLTQSKSTIEELKEELKTVVLINKIKINELVDSLKNRLEEEETKVLRIPKEQRQYFNLRRSNKLLSDLYTFLLNKRSEASIAKASNVTKVQVLDFATPYRVSYVGPVSSNIYTLALFLGLGIPLGIIFFMYYFNNKIIDSSDLEKITTIPIIGSIAHKKGMDSNILVHKNLKSLVSESFRGIRTNINFMVSGKEQIKVLITSSISGEGKTFTAINLASIYAASGKRTIILGADLRKPKIFSDFGLTNELGLSTYLINKASSAEVIQSTKISNLDLISSGPVPPNPAELIESNRMDQLISDLEKQYDVIIIDTPPLGLVTDALLLKKYVDASLYIVRHNYTSQTYLKYINKLHDEKLMTNLGIIVNAVKQKKMFGKYGYGYGNNYGYGYGYGYYSDEE